MRLPTPVVPILVALLLMLPAAAQAQVINACVNKKGSMRIVSDLAECKASETPLSWNKAGEQGEPGLDGMDGMDGMAGADGLNGINGLDARELLVFDADGNEIGVFIDGGATSFLRVFHEPSASIFGIIADGLEARGVTLTFLDTACESAPFTHADSGSGHGGFLLRSSDGEFWTIETGETPTIMTAGSRLDESGCFTTKSVLPLVPLRSVDQGLLPTLPLPLPLYVGLSPE